MKRIGLVVLATLSGLTCAAAQQPVPARYAAGEPNLGGGFIEFLFGGMNGSAPAQQRSYRQAAAYPAYPASPAEPAYRQPSYQVPNYYEPYEERNAQPPMVRHGYAEPTHGERRIDPRYLKQVVDYDGNEKPGTIIVDTPSRFLYLVLEDGKALRYGIGVGRPGFTWAGVKTVTRKAEWPDWVPPPEMLKRRPDLPHFMAGGPDNPLGARALYLGSSLYRIHGSNEPWTIGQAVSSGCIRMRNEDVIDLYDRVKVGARVVVI
jgi:lipoprotein-anchoring transpeptidase ErfK/SrfK